MIGKIREIFLFALSSLLQVANFFLANFLLGVLIVGEILICYAMGKEEYRGWKDAVGSFAVTLAILLVGWTGSLMSFAEFVAVLIIPLSLDCLLAFLVGTLRSRKSDTSDTLPKAQMATRREMRDAAVMSDEPSKRHLKQPQMADLGFHGRDAVAAPATLNPAASSQRQQNMDQSIGDRPGRDEAAETDKMDGIMISLTGTGARACAQSAKQLEGYDDARARYFSRGSGEGEEAGLCKRDGGSVETQQDNHGLISQGAQSTGRNSLCDWENESVDHERASSIEDMSEFMTSVHDHPNVATVQWDSSTKATSDFIGRYLRITRKLPLSRVRRLD